jgi:hypothetical protein
MEPCHKDIGNAVGKVGDHHSGEIGRCPMRHHNISCKSTHIVIFLVITPNNPICG